MPSEPANQFETLEISKASAMRVALWLALAVLFSQEYGQSKGSQRGKRSILDMVLTLWCYRHRLQTPLLALNLYGCYCGTGGSGKPLDAVDQCCFLHDCCYRHTRISLKCHRRVKWQRYKLLCKSSETECRSTSTCGRMACECDKQLAECLTAAKPKKKHSFYNRGDLCKGPKDFCPVVHRNWTDRHGEPAAREGLTCTSTFTYMSGCERTVRPEPTKS